MKIQSLDSEIRDKLNAELPRNIIQTRDSGGIKLNYVSGSTVIDILNHIFGSNWSWTIKAYWREDSIPTYAKEDRQKKNPYPQSPVIHCLGTLTVTFKDENGSNVTISKDGFGSKSVVGGQSSQENNYKAASTDALKKAASMFGIAAQLYRDKNEQVFFEDINFETL